LEYDYIVTKIIPDWKKEFIPWFKKLKYEDIMEIIEGLKARLDHDFIDRTFETFLHETGAINYIDEVPFIFDSQDSEWIEPLAELLMMEEDELVSMNDELDKYYKTLDTSKYVGMDRLTAHQEIITDYLS
jgi:hypothetical protein